MDEYGGLVSRTQARHQCERACAQLLGVIGGITADGQLHDLEIQYLRTWLAEHRQAAEHWLGAQLTEHIDRVMVDGVVIDEERAQLLSALQAASGVQFAETGSVTAEAIHFPADDCAVVFADRVFCLTGKFEYGSRADCEMATTVAGGRCAPSVSKAVHYLVIGDAGATASWKHSSYGAKIDTAMKLREKGHPIYVLTEAAWRGALPVASSL